MIPVLKYTHINNRMYFFDLCVILNISVFQDPGVCQLFSDVLLPLSFIAYSFSFMQMFYYKP